MKELLFGVSATDPLTFGAVAFVLAAVTLLASYISCAACDEGGSDRRVAVRIGEIRITSWRRGTDSNRSSPFGFQTLGSS
jgi:hypothetical protein